MSEDPKYPAIPWLAAEAAEYSAARGELVARLREALWWVREYDGVIQKLRAESDYNALVHEALELVLSRGETDTALRIVRGEISLWDLTEMLGMAGPSKVLPGAP